MRRVLLVLFLAMVVSVPAAAAEPPALVKARTLYNAGDYDGAIAAASEVRTGDWADAALLVAARSHLEKFRRSSQPAELQAGREALNGVRASGLMPRDHVDLLIGMGQFLYLSEEFGAAAGLFDNALAQAFLLNRQDRLQLLDWWATAVDRYAQMRPSERRGVEFATILERMEDELRRDTANPVANYWIPVAARECGRCRPRVGCRGRGMAAVPADAGRRTHASRRPRSPDDAGHHSGAGAAAQGHA